MVLYHLMSEKLHDKDDSELCFPEECARHNICVLCVTPGHFQLKPKQREYASTISYSCQVQNSVDARKSIMSSNQVILLQQINIEPSCRHKT